MAYASLFLNVIFSFSVSLENTPLEWHILHIPTSEDIDDFTDVSSLSQFVGV